MIDFRFLAGKVTSKSAFALALGLGCSLGLALPCLATPVMGDAEVGGEAARLGKGLVLRLKQRRSEVRAFRSAVKSFPLQRVFYGWQEGKKLAVNSLIEEEYLKGRVRRTQYIIESEKASDGYIFDPLPLPDGQRVLFKFGQSESSGVSYRLFLLHKGTGQIKAVLGQDLVDTGVQLSPDCRFVAVLAGDGDTSNTDDSKPYELWVCDLQTGTNRRVVISNSLQNTLNWLPLVKRGKVASPGVLSYSRIESLRKDEGKAGVKLPVTYLYDCATQRSRVWAGNWTGVRSVSRLAPNRKWLLYSGPVTREKDYSVSMGGSEFLNFWVFLQRLGEPKPTKVVVPEKVVPKDELIPIAYSYWAPDSRRFISLFPRWDRQKEMAGDWRYGEWNVLRFKVEKNKGVTQVRNLAAVPVISRAFYSHVSLLGFASGVSSMDALLVAKSYVGDATIVDGDEVFLQRKFVLQSVDLESGKRQILHSWVGARGMGALTREGRVCRTALY